MNNFNFRNILPALLLLLAIVNFGPIASSQTWTEIQPEANYWQASALSSDGVIILAAHGSGVGQRAGLLKRSNDGGVNWVNVGTTPTENKNWYSLAMSVNGQYMMAGEYQGRIYRSTDGGANWTETRPAGDLNGIWGISMSDNGQTVLAANWDRRLYKSSDFGTTWAELQPAGDNNQGWSVVAVSGDGNTFVAGIWGTKNIYVSHTAGADWSTAPGLPNDTFWQSADLSYDGQIAYISTTNSLLGPLKSTDGLASWSEMSVGNTSAYQRGISCSSDGLTLAITFRNEQKIYYSTNGGSSWSNNSIPPYPTAYFQGTTVSVSQDGSTILGLTADYMRGGYYWDPDIPYGHIYKGILPLNIPPAAGDGTIADPYQIATLANLNWLSTTTSVWDFKYFIQTADIDAVATKFQNPDGVGGYAGFSPIGGLNSQYFNGTYDGNGKTISNLYINRAGGTYAGLFGMTEGTIKNLGVLNADVTGGTYAGILIGQNKTPASIHDCYSSGSVKGASAGGLVGWHGGGTVELCYSTASVQTTADGESNSAGGLIAKLSGAALVQNCYANGSVSGTMGNCIGGLIGSTQDNVTVKKCYAKGAVTLVGTSSYAGGLFGNAIWRDESPYTIEDCYWDTHTSGQDESSGGTGVVGKTTAEMLTQSTYPNWNFSYPWNMIPGNYPVLYILGPSFSGGNGTMGSPFQIANIDDLLVLNAFPVLWNKYFIQTANIDAAGSALLPIGNSDINFTGSYDGQNFTIDHFAYDGLAIDDMEVGFFKHVSGASLKNIKLTHLNLSAFVIIGGLAGIAVYTTVDNCFVSGNLTCLLVGGGLVGKSENSTFSRCGTDVVFTGNILLYGPAANTHLGGFAGLVEGSSTFTNCYARGSVSGYKISGFVGGLDWNSTIFGDGTISHTMGFTLINCYAANTLTVSDGGEKGGLYGQSGYTGSSIIMTSSYWDNELAATANGYIGENAKTTAQMKTQATFEGWDFSTPIWSLNSLYNGGYPNLDGQAESVWTGNTSTAWNTAGNWSANAVPTANADIIIPDVANDPVVAASIGANCRNLTVNSGATLTVQSGGSLITTGTVTGNMTIQRFAAGNTLLNANTYHLVSVPLHPDNVSLSNLFLGSYLYQYLPATNAWQGMGTTTTTELNETLGYMIYYPNTGTTYSFTGVPNTGTFAPSVTYPGNSGGLNFALVPNPYPSNIDWNAATGWTKTNIGTSIWVYNNGNYGVWDGTSGTNLASQHISVGQAFFVQTTAASPVLTMDNRVRTHSDATFLKNSNTAANQLRVRADANTMVDELLVGFGESANNAYNASEDALKLQGAATAPQLSTLADNIKLSINNLAAINSGTVVPMNFETEFEGNVTLTFSQIESFPANLAIRLQDNLTSQLIDLRKQSTYTFAHLQSNSSKRFELLFGSATGIDEQKTSGGNIWISKKTVNISSPTSVGEKALIEIFNAAGQMVFSKQITLSSITQVPTSLYGFAVVKVNTGKNVWIAKGIF
ncbi:MAG: GLUG motif-containing protein [Bacteroidota bacterium]